MAKATSKEKGASARARITRTSSRAGASRAGAANDHTPSNEEPREDDMELAAADDELEGDEFEGDDDESLRLDPGMLASAGSGGGTLAVAPPTSRRVAPPEALLRIPGAQFIYESYLELTKVTWPTWETARNMTLVVIAFSAVVAIIIAITDIVFSQVLSWLLSLGGA